MTTITWQSLLEGRIDCATSTRSRLRNCRPHYVYILCRADGTPFYVGKGVNRRCFDHEAETRTTPRLSHKLNLMRAMAGRGEKIGYCIDSSHDEARDALDRERSLIRLFGRHDLGTGPLTNQTDGGEEGGNWSPELLERKRANLGSVDAEDEDRRVANRFFHELCTVQSVPIKPLKDYGVEGLWANRSKFAMSPRQAAALAGAAICNRVMLAPEAEVSRRMQIAGKEMIIENGVGRDMLSSGMARLRITTVGFETLQLTPGGHSYILSTIGRAKLIAAGVLSPE